MNCYFIRTSLQAARSLTVGFRVAGCTITYRRFTAYSLHDHLPSVSTDGLQIAYIHTHTLRSPITVCIMTGYLKIKQTILHHLPCPYIVNDHISLTIF